MRQWRNIFAVVGVAGVLCAAYPVRAQPSADQVLADMQLSADDKRKVMSGEFVTGDLPPVSERDLSVSIAFLVKTSPDDLAKQIMAGDLISADSQVQAHGQLTSPGSLADLAGLQISADEAQRLSHAKAGQSLNLATAEIAAFNALQGATPQAVQRQLQQMLLARFQAYQTSGLAGNRSVRSRQSMVAGDSDPCLRRGGRSTPRCSTGRLGEPG
jgi:hypothetical protein